MAGARRAVKPRRRKPTDPARAWAKRLARTRPDLVAYVLTELASMYGRPTWKRRLGPTSADTNAERAFESLRRAFPSTEPAESHDAGDGWGGLGLSNAAPPDWLAVAQAPRIQAALRLIRAERGDHSLEFLGEMPALEARNWLTRIDGVGRKTASVLLLFSFGTPLMPVDRHVERVGWRVGLIPPRANADHAHELYLAMLEPDQ